jgi:hypothetical protein
VLWQKQTLTFYDLLFALAMRHSLKGIQMQKKTLTLKSRHKKPALPVAQAAPICVVAGRANKGQQHKSCHAVLDRLTELVKDRCKVFIQMRHGTGYCGIAAYLNDGWLKMEQVSIYGTKQTATTPCILIQINDGRFIAHIHPTDSTEELHRMQGVKS